MKIKYVVFSLFMFFMFSLCNVKAFTLPGEYEIEVDSNEKLYPNLRDEYFSCRYGKGDNYLSVVFIGDEVYLGAIQDNWESLDIINASEERYLLFEKSGSDNHYTLSSQNVNESNPQKVFEKIWYDKVNNKNKFLTDVFTQSIQDATLDVSKFGKNKDTNGSICPGSLKITSDGNKYKIELTDDFSSNDDNNTVIVNIAGITEVEEELNNCVKNEDCSVSDINIEDEPSDETEKKQCYYRYSYKETSQCATFSFTKNNDQISLIINDTFDGNRVYRYDESIYNGAKPHQYINGMECYDSMYMFIKNDDVLWINPKNPANNAYGEPTEVKLTDAANCGKDDPKEENKPVQKPDYNVDLSGCIIDEGTQEIIDWIMNLIRLVGIILLIGLGMLDFIKAAASGEQEEMKKNSEKFVKRLIACVALFLAPIFVDIILSLINLTSGENCNYSSSNKSEAKPTTPENSQVIAKNCSVLDISDCSKRSDCDWRGSTCKLKDEFIVDSETNYSIRNSAPSLDKNSYSYKLYYTDSITPTPPDTVGECSWYASKRAYEITTNLGVTPFEMNSSTGLSGNQFCSFLTNYDSYKYCTGSNCKLEQGAIVSWNGDEHGHVGIIEKVNSDGTYLLGHGMVKFGGYALNKNYNSVYEVWPDIYAGKVTRMDNCTASYGNYNNTGCYKLETKTEHETRTLYGYTIGCVIYLKQPKN